MKKEDALRTIEEGLAELNDALAAGRSERLTRYLELVSHFHRYSFGNLLLIMAQFPDARHVAGFHKWKELGRHVRKGAQGIGILAPLSYKVTDEHGEESRVVRGFKVVHVWDISQTEGDDLPEFASVTGDAGDNLSRIEQLIRDENIELVYGPLPPGTLGLCSDGRITIRHGLNESERFSVAVHEVGHHRLHKGARKHEATKTVKETEAEAVAFVVCRAIGLSCIERSSDYISLYRGSSETLSESLDYIQKTAAWIIERLRSVAVPSSGELSRLANRSTDAVVVS